MRSTPRNKNGRDDSQRNQEVVKPARPSKPLDGAAVLLDTPPSFRSRPRTLRRPFVGSPRFGGESSSSLGKDAWNGYSIRAKPACVCTPGRLVTPPHSSRRSRPEHAHRCCQGHL